MFRSIEDGNCGNQTRLPSVSDPPATARLHVVLIVIAYDIADDGRRTAASNVLEDYGRRVNYSVFECDLSHAAFLQLQTELEDRIDTETDRLVFYLLCATCRGRRRACGKETPDPPGAAIIV